MTRVPPTPPTDDDISLLVARVAADDTVAQHQLYALLRSHLRTTVKVFLSEDSLEAEDVISETITVVFRYIVDRSGFEGDLVRFAITIARNRCRNILNKRARHPHDPIEPLIEWVAHPDRSPLDLIQEEEARDFLQAAIDKLESICKLILRAFYLEGRPIASIRAATGLKTLQGVYYRRTVCLRKLAEVLADRMGEHEF